jgi:hypothetical protein
MHDLFAAVHGSGTTEKCSAQGTIKAYAAQSSEDRRARSRAEIEKWWPIIKAAEIKAE